MVNSLGGPVIWVGQSLRGIQGGANGVSQVDGVSDMAPVCQLCWGEEGVEKGQWPLLILMPDTSVPPFMLLVPFKLLPWCWSSEGVRV